MRSVSSDLGSSLRNLGAQTGLNIPFPTRSNITEILTQWSNASLSPVRYALERMKQPMSALGDHMRFDENKLRIGSYHEIRHKGKHYLIQKPNKKTIVIYQVIE